MFLRRWVCHASTSMVYFELYLDPIVQLHFCYSISDFMKLEDNFKTQLYCCFEVFFLMLTKKISVTKEFFYTKNKIVHFMYLACVINKYNDF